MGSTIATHFSGEESKNQFQCLGLGHIANNFYNHVTLSWTLFYFLVEVFLDNLAQDREWNRCGVLFNQASLQLRFAHPEFLKRMRPHQRHLSGSGCANLILSNVL